MDNISKGIVPITRRNREMSMYGTTHFGDIPMLTFSIAILFRIVWIRIEMLNPTL